MERYLKISRAADLALGFVFLGMAIYSLVGQSYLMAGVWFASSVLSFVSVKVAPARWVVTRMLMSRLKA